MDEFKYQTRRGVYRSLYVALWLDSDFQRLSPIDKLLFLYLRTSPLSNLPVIYPIYFEAVEKHTGIARAVIKKSLKHLQDQGWIEVDHDFIWIKKGLLHDPVISLRNPKHRLHILSVVAGLPKMKIVENFCQFYGLPNPHDIPNQYPSDRVSNDRDSEPYANQDKDKKKDEDEENEPISTLLSGFSKAKTFPDQKSSELEERRLLLKKQARELGVKC